MVESKGFEPASHEVLDISGHPHDADGGRSQQDTQPRRNPDPGSASGRAARSLRIDGEDAPAARDALQRMGSAVHELKPGTSHEVLDGVRDEYLVGSGKASDTRTNVDRDAAELRAHDLALTRVKTGPDVESELLDTRRDRTGGADRPRWSVEGGQESVARRVDFAAPEPASSLRTSEWWASRRAC